MRQRLAIADALVKRPRILILDEPTIGIDPEGVREMLAMLERFRNDEVMTVLLSSHLLHQVQEVCDRVGIFVGGRLIAAGPVSDLERQLAQQGDLETDLRAVTPDGRELTKTGLEHLRQVLASLEGVGEVALNQGTLTLSSREDVCSEIAQAVFDQGLLPVHLRLRGLSLDDIYDRYFREGADAVHVSV
jgi:ABC-2 type transport system ATP-binding protein